MLNRGDIATPNSIRGINEVMIENHELPAHRSVASNRNPGCLLRRWLQEKVRIQCRAGLDILLQIELNVLEDHIKLEAVGVNDIGEDNGHQATANMTPAPGQWSRCREIMWPMAQSASLHSLRRIAAGRCHQPDGFCLIDVGSMSALPHDKLRIKL